MAPLLSVGERFFQLAMLLIAVWEGACHHTLVLAIWKKISEKARSVAINI